MIQWVGAELPYTSGNHSRDISYKLQHPHGGPLDTVVTQAAQRTRTTVLHEERSLKQRNITWIRKAASMALQRCTEVVFEWLRRREKHAP